MQQRHFHAGIPDPLKVSQVFSRHRTRRIWYKFYADEHSKHALHWFFSKKTMEDPTNEIKLTLVPSAMTSAYFLMGLHANTDP